MTYEDLMAVYDRAALLDDRNIVRLLAGTVVANQVKGNPVWLMLVANSSGGKCLGKDTQVMMYDGSIKMVQDIKEGELLMGDDSSPRKVLATTSGVDTMYRVSQQNGNDYVVNSKHILTLKQTVALKTYKGIKKGDIIDVPIEEYIDKPDRFKVIFNGVKAPVQFSERKITIEPYYLGLWLGDGNSREPLVHKPDIEIKNYIQEYADRLGMRFSVREQDSTCPGYAIVTTKGSKNNLKERLKSYGLMPKKFIPQDFLINSRENRLNLLAGLIDSDGHRSGRGGRFEFVSKNKEMASQVLFLARTLGFKTSLSKMNKGIKSYGFIGEYYQVNIVGPVHLIPTKIARKKAPNHPWKRDMLATGISVENIGVGDYYGFQVDGNGRYLLGDCTITHNSMLLSTLMGLEVIEGVQHTFGISDLTENTFASAFKSTDKKSASLLENMPFGGLMIFKDFTSMLTKRKEARDVIMSQLREIYDGRYDRRTGNNKDTQWQGQVGALAGVTEAVHEYMPDMSAMGDRFVMYSPKMPDRRKLLEFTMKMRVSGTNQSELLEDAKQAMAEYIHQALPHIHDIQLNMNDKDREYLMDVCDFVTKARSGVIEDFRTNAVRFVPSAEMPTRMIDQLLSIGKAFCVLRHAEGKSTELDKNDMDVLFKIAFDSIPIKRLWALRQIAGYLMGVTSAGVGQRIGYETNVVQQWLAQLAALGIVHKVYGSRQDLWMLNDEYRQIMQTYQHIEAKNEVLESDSQMDTDDFLVKQALNQSW